MNTTPQTEPAAQTQPADGRASNGRFARGNPGGTGNPFARQVAALRQGLLDAVSPEDMAAIAQALAEKAKQGDVAAAKVLLGYLVGKPAPAPDPDRMDMEEVGRLRERAGLLRDMTPLFHAPDAGLFLDILREVRSAKTGGLASRLGAALRLSANENAPQGAEVVVDGMSCSSPYPSVPILGMRGTQRGQNAA